MPESTNSETWVLSKEDQTDAYKCILKLQSLDTRLYNWDVLFRTGHFIDVFEELTEQRRELKTAIADLQEFVKTLQSKGIWINV